tara:strand:- start:683 stop:2407 length:1725 start_codon:yes stop_codon:yes gene_type:complete
MVPNKINQRVDLDTYLLRAEIARKEEKYYESAEYYLNATLISDDPEIAAYTSQLLRELNLYKMGLSSAEKWKLLKPNDAQVYQYLGFFNLMLERKEQAIQDFKTFLSKTDRVDESLVMIIDLLISELNASEWKSDIKILSGQVNTNSAGYYYGLARIAIDNNDLYLADRNFEKISILKPDWAEMKILHAKTLFYSNEEKKALEISKKLYNDFNNPEIKLEHINLLIAALKNSEAENLLNKIIDQYPNFHEAKRSLALLNLSMDDLDSSRENFIILRSLPNYRSESNYFLGRIAEHEDIILSAIRLYSRVTSGTYVIESQSRVADLFYHNLNDLDGAITHLDDFASANQEYSIAMLNKKINILFLTKNYNRAFDEIAYFRELGIHNDDLKEIHIGLYLAISNEIIANGNLEEAKNILDEALEIYNDDLSLSYQLAIVYQEKNDYTKSIKLLEDLLNREPKNANILNAAGYLLTNKLNNHDKALIYIKEALAIEPNDPAIIDSMGWVLFNLGELEEALTYLEKAYNILPDPEISSHLILIYWEIGNYQEATDLLEKELKKNPQNKYLKEIKREIQK